MESMLAAPVDPAAPPPPESATLPMGAPAEFGAHVAVYGDVTAPAQFDRYTLFLPSFDVGRPATFGPPAVSPVSRDVGKPVVVVPDAPAIAPPAPSAAVMDVPASVVTEVASPPPLEQVQPTPVLQRVTPAAAPRVWPWMVALVMVALVPWAAWMVTARQRAVVVVPPPPAKAQPRYARLDLPRILPPTVAAFDPLPPFAQQVVMRGSKTLKVALTFDLCSTRHFVGWDDRVTDILERYEVPATLFLGGRFIRERPDAVKLFASNPLFDLQGHAYLHPHLPDLTPSRVVQELVMTDQALFDTVGRRATLFRPPFGEYTLENVRAATRAGYLPIQFDVASGDPDPNFHTLRLTLSVVTQVQGGSIVVLHANAHGVHTAEALALIIENLRDRGFELTTVGDVLADGPWITDDGTGGPRRTRPIVPTLAQRNRAAESTPVSAVGTP